VGAAYSCRKIHKEEFHEKISPWHSTKLADSALAGACWGCRALCVQRGNGRGDEYLFARQLLLFNIDVAVSANGTKGSISKNTPVAFMNVYSYNSCTNTTGIVEYGMSMDNIQFSAPGAGGSNQLPKSVTASGTVPVIDAYTSATDNLTFNLALKPLAPYPQEFMETLHASYTAWWLPNQPSVTADSHSETNYSQATGKLTVTSQNLGPLPIANFLGNINDGRAHTLTITR